MHVLGVIPARYQSQRLPGKLLAMIGNRPMVQWVYEAAKSCPAFHSIIVATDSEEVASCVRSLGGQVEMTRIVTPDMLTQLVEPYARGESPEMTTLACPLDPQTGYTDPNVVKVVCDRHGRALYFSRAPIPYYRNPGPAPVFHHLGLYSFRRDFLLQYARLPATPLEQCEGLEQLRVLEHGYTIVVCQTQKAVVEVNTPDDLRQAQVVVAKGVEQ